MRFESSPSGSHRRVLADAPLLDRIAEDPILRDTKLIAEAWDAAGAYQVGRFSVRWWADVPVPVRDVTRSAAAQSKEAAAAADGATPRCTHDISWIGRRAGAMRSAQQPSR